MNKDKTKFNNFGFTLVEMIVVIVILAILAAIITPMLLSYIDEAREKQALVNARSCLHAAQAELTKMYANKKEEVPPGNEEKNCVINQIYMHKFKNNNGDANITHSAFADSVIDKADVNPICLVIGLGSNMDNSGRETKWSVTEHDKYTVYFVFYLEDMDSKPCIYYNGEWTRKYPRNGNNSNIFDSSNIVMTGPLKGKRIQYYCLVNDTGKVFTDKPFWDWMRSFD